MHRSVLPTSAPCPILDGRGPRLAPVSPCRAGLRLEKPDKLWEAGGKDALPFSSPPPYLDGSLAGDRGFDPLRLATVKPGAVGEKEGLDWMVEGELYNGRVAMTAVLGVVVQELLGKGPWWSVLDRIDLAPGIPAKRNVIPHIWQCTVGQGTCPDSAYGGTQNYTADVGFVPAPGVDKYWAVITVLHVVYGYLEYCRYRNFRQKGVTGFGPWAPFDPINLTSDRNRQAEVRNGRLAMLAMLGFAVQAKTTGLEPIEGLKAHLANPTGNNILTNAPGTFTFLLAAIGFVGAVEVARNRSEKEAGAQLSRFEL